MLPPVEIVKCRECGKPFNLETTNWMVVQDHLADVHGIETDMWHYLKPATEATVPVVI